MKAWLDGSLVDADAARVSVTISLAWVGTRSEMARKTAAKPISGP